jgi:Xaa-Pro aminopeptidase
MNPFAKRREKLSQLIGDGIVIVSNRLSNTKDSNTEFKKYDNNFFYLTGLTKPNSLLILDTSTNCTTFFGNEKQHHQAIWTGEQLSPQEIKMQYGFDKAYCMHELDNQLLSIFTQQPIVFWSMGCDPILDKKLANYKIQYHNLLDTISTMRLIKDKTEIQHLKTAGKISALAHQHAMHTIQPNQYEYQIESELLYQFMQQGARLTAYDSIVASGKNACTLHYSENSALLKDGELLLIDAGCQWQGYTSDITRTVPVNGRFSPIQKVVYEIVLEAQLAAIRTIRPHVNCQEIGQAALSILVQGMVDLKLLSGSVEAIIENKTYQQFYMHNIGHWLGLDVHDVGGKMSQSDLKLLPNMCLTVEPGLYIRPNPDIPSAFHHIGIRIEDDILVTKTGCEVYTASDAPKSVQAIEDIMRGAI